MELRFVTPQLAKLDELDTEVLVANVFSDVRPPRGIAGLCDWRLGGRVSKLMRDGFVTGKLGEVVMVPGKPLLTIDKVLLFGCGERAGLDEPRFRVLSRSILNALARLKTRTGIVELPGRTDGLIPAVRATEIVLEEAAASLDHDVWTLVETNEGRASIEQHLVEQRRRIRRMP